MVRLTDKQLDNLLREVFHQEAEKIAVPSSARMWHDLEQRVQKLEKEKGAGPHSGPVIAQRPGWWSYGYDLFKKHKALASLIAACFIFFILFSGIPQAAAFRNFVVNIFTFSDRGKVYLQMDRQEERAEKESFPEAQIAGEEKEIRAAVEDETQAKALDYSTPPGADLPEDKEVGIAALPALEEEAAPGEKQDLPHLTPLKEYSFRIASLGEDTAEPEVLLLEEEEKFLASLQDFRNLAPEKIWSAGTLPESFSFAQGYIAKTGELLLYVRWEFADREGKRITLTQHFFRGEMAQSLVFSSVNDTAYPVQVRGYYRGYLIRQRHGFSSLVWIQENSSVILSGEVEEAELLGIADSLKAI